MDYGRVYENIVCIELFAGIHGYVGNSIKRNDMCQRARRRFKSAVTTVRKETFERECSPQLQARAYPKMRIARTKNPKYVMKESKSMIYEWFYKNKQAKYLRHSLLNDGDIFMMKGLQKLYQAAKALPKLLT